MNTVGLDHVASSIVLIALSASISATVSVVAMSLSSPSRMTDLSLATTTIPTTTVPTTTTTLTCDPTIEELQFTGVAIGDTSVNVTVRNSGPSCITILRLYVDDEDKTAYTNVGAGITFSPRRSVTIILTDPHFTSGAPTFKIVTARGFEFTYTYLYAPEEIQFTNTIMSTKTTTLTVRNALSRSGVSATIDLSVVSRTPHLLTYGAEPSCVPVQDNAGKVFWNRGVDAPVMFSLHLGRPSNAKETPRLLKEEASQRQVKVITHQKHPVIRED